MPASCSCVFPPLASGEDHPIKQGGWSEQKAGCQLGHRGQKGISANGAQQELRLGRSASLALGVGPEGIKGVTGVNESEAGTTPGTCVVVAWMGAGGSEGWMGEGWETMRTQRQCLRQPENRGLLKRSL